MAKESIRFLHAGEFHLERAMQDLTDLPEHLKSNLANAPWAAAEAIFEAAIVENVDFVLLTGDLLNPISCGAAGPAFLMEQFERLAQRKIEVYWAGGTVDDPDRGPTRSSCPTTSICSPRNKSSRSSFDATGSRSQPSLADRAMAASRSAQRNSKSTPTILM